MLYEHFKTIKNTTNNNKFVLSPLKKFAFLWDMGRTFGITDVNTTNVHIEKSEIM